MNNIFRFSSGNLPVVKSRLIFSFIRYSNKLIIFFTILILALSVSCKKNNTENEGLLQKKWDVKLPAEIYYCSPALSIDEKTVFIGTSTSLFGTHGKNQFFVALDAASGKESWRLPLGFSEVRSSPAVASDNSIYFSVEARDPLNGTFIGDELWHISPEGDLLWTFNINPLRLTMEVGQSAPAIGLDGTIYVAGDKLYAVNSDGSLRWSVFGSTNEALRNAPVIGVDGTVYFVYHNIPLTALDPASGSVIWTCQLGVNDHCFASPAIGTDGTIYVAINSGLLYAISPDGQPIWTFDLESVGFSGTFRSSPAIDADGCLYFGINTGNPVSAFFSLNQDGSLKWIFEPSDLPADVPSTHFDIYSSPAIGSDGVVYFGQEFGRVYGLNTSDGSLAGMVTTNSGITWSSPAIDDNGVLYISDLSGMVYAIQTKSQGLDKLAAWPKFRYDNQNGGRFMGLH